MRHIGFIMENGFQVMGMAALSAFEFANETLGAEAYRLTVMSENGGSIRSSLGIGIETQPLADFPDTLMVVGELLPKPVSAVLRDYIARAGRESRRVAGVCTGAFLLAEAGLLDGKSATTHWAHARSLQERFPNIHVDDDRIFIQDGSIWTSAGMSSAIDLTLALIEDDHGAELSRSIARKLVVYHRRPGGQSQFSALLELEPRSDRVRRALVYAKEHLRNPLTVEELAEAASLSPRQFSRLFREETGQSPAKAVERLRLEAAKVMLEDGRHPLDIVARDTGFADRDRMRRAFLRFFGQPPQGLRRSLKLIEGVEDPDLVH
ncbi:MULTISPECIES: GlxA family transcriptional regulator [Rhizobiaceae]|uniref:Bifunctional protein: class I glutamine amidotransferase-like (N-terminal), transcriptional regulator protein AraC/XylS family (C-terminal) n=1 Tax=Agrobacterium genomosp. 2 str. CFBP 5494 TaxID=1183436 RepID=A0A9W5F643_9HYPH|nr:MULTISPECIES: GlxA family transcriptional regulator [Rhizobiaceae]MBX4893416.1 GlxA family transcriptional regulator [Rhizobium bangladeshense]MBX4917422.1 GlxA family transcriptional regulator [Rhizobium bangladeshense]MDF1631465.1 GlxA family transcriptional regulator [Mycoplana sp. MJR14]QSY97532.1 GlxA family transcriptional regulator [Rhizobium bangladeshense]RSC21389.1 GlxA family transcriptional regulator [Agrobacterium sp. FDAARGOS_525]